MYRHIGRYLIALAVALVTVGAAPALANECEAGKSLFVNISAERPNAVQVALLVAFANAGPEYFPPPTESDEPVYFGGQEARVSLFFSDAAASYAIDLTSLTKKQQKKLDNFLHKEFGYRIEDIVRLQGGDPDLNGPLPDIRMLQGFGAQVFGCSLCVAEALQAAGIEGVDPNDAETLTPYLLPDTAIMSPSAFYLIYDRIEEEGDPCRDITAAVISF